MKRKVKGFDLPFFAIVVLLLLLYTFRSVNVGWDTATYLNIFKHSLQEKIFHSYLEPGWVILNQFFYKICPTQQMFFAGIGGLGILTFWYAVKRLSCDIYLSFLCCYLLGFYFNLMNQQRECIAVMICMISFYLLYQDQTIPAILATLTAIMFHKSAFIFLGYIVFIKVVKKYNYKLYMIVGSGTIVVLIFFDKLFDFATRLFYGQYITEEHLVKHLTPGNLKVFAAYLALFGILFYLDKRSYRTDSEIDRKHEAKRRMLFTAVIFSLILQLISIKSHMIARFSNYFSIYFTILIPDVLERIHKPEVRRQYRYLIIAILFVFMIIYLRFSENGFGRDGVIPYTFEL